MREVDAKRKSWRMHSERKKANFLGRHLIPVIWGPKEQHYVIDHHHLALALHRDGVKEVATTIVADLRRLPRNAFWIYLDNRGWLHPFDAEGQRRDYDHVPKRLSDLVDEPYRSLAGELRLRGGFAKGTTPFNEFLWADFLRRRIKPKAVTEDFTRALRLALRYSQGSETSYLPGWCGPSERA